MNDQKVVNISESELIINATMARMSKLFDGFGVSDDGARDLNKVYGYNTNPSFDQYFSMFKRSGVANRLCSAVPRACWREGLTINGDNDEPVLVDELKELRRRGMFSKLERSDILNRVGSFSVLFVGVPDGMTADKPLGTSNADQLDEVYFTPYNEGTVNINKWVTDPLDPRFGLPESYELTPSDENVADSESTPIKSIVAHWSRVVHMAEGALSNDVYGLPYLSPVYNRILDLNKTIGGGAEAYFRNAVGKFALEVEKEFKGVMDQAGKDALRTEVKNFTDGMQNYMRLNGMSAKSLSSPHQDPQSTADTILKEISAYTGLPIRILTGEGGGQYSGNEDKQSFNTIVSDRQGQICEPWLNNVLEILDDAEMIELPDNYSITWPLDESTSEKEKSEVMLNKARALELLSKALAGPMGGGLEGEITNEQAITEILGLEYKPEGDVE
jgi:hypothetical protein